MYNFLKFIIFSYITSSLQFPSLCSSQSPHQLPSSPDPLFLFPSEKSVLPKLHKTRHKPYQCRTKQPSRKPRVPRAGKTVRDSPYSHCWDFHKLHINVYTEDLVLTHTGSLFVTPNSVSASEPCLVDSVDHVLPVSLTPLATTIFALLPLWFSDLCIMFDYGYMHLLPSVSRQGLSDDN